MKKINFQQIITILILGLFSQFLTSQSNIKYGSNYIVFEAEDTDTPLGNKWIVRKPGDTEYLKYLTNLGGSPAPVNNTYLEYIGPWLGADSELEYKFTAPSTGVYRLAMRMHSPLRDHEEPDKRNDVFIKLEGNFTSNNANISESRARTLTKFYGRGPNKWGTCINLEFEHKHQRPIYNLIEGEEYTLTMKGRSNGVSYDYIALYTNTKWIDQNADLALQLPTEIQPFVNITGLSIVNPTPGELREGTSLQLSTIATPTNASGEATWSSSNDAIISVDVNGNITAHGSVGEKATITATSSKDTSVIASEEISIVTFYEIAIESVDITTSTTDYIVGDNITLATEVLPSTTHDPSLTWTSSDDTIASVNSLGVVTAKKEGTVIIKATSNQNNTLFDEITLNIVPFAEQSVAFDDNNKYKNGTYYNQGNMEVTIDYHAGSLKTVGQPIKLFLRELNSSWQVQNDVLVTLSDPVGTSSGSVTANIPLDGLTPTADLPTGYFYFLFVILENSDGTKVNKGLNPIIILDKSLSVEDEILRNSISLYPNPAKDFITVQKNDNFESLQLELYSISGAKVMSDVIDSNSKTIQTNHLSSGIYLMRIKSDKTVITKKLIIK